MENKIKLEIIDPSGIKQNTYEMDFKTSIGDRMILTIGEKKYVLRTDGNLISIFDNK